MRRYPEYKECGVAWIGKIPVHFEVKRLKYVADLNMGQSPPSEEYNSDSLGAPFLQGNADFGPHHPTPKIYCPTARKHAIPGDILLSVRAPVGAINIADQEYGIGRGLCAICPRTNHLERRYAKYLLEVARTELHIVATGTTYDAVTVDDVSNITCVVPPLSEQTQIANFLDRKTRQIDEIICIKEQRIELLQERRTVLINQVVTKGLDPNVEMKPSGVEWIGEIPKHWTMTRLKYLGESIIGLSYKPEDVTDDKNGTLVLRASNIQNGKPSFLDNVYVNAEVDEKLRLKAGDILICSRSGSRELIGKNTTITKKLEGITFGVFMTVFRTKFFRFISHFLNSQVFKNQSGLFLTTTINQLTINTLNNFLICFPIDEKEQTQIANFLDCKTKQIDELISTEQRKVELFKEYRQSLISEVVTGKIDVRSEV